MADVNAIAEEIQGLTLMEAADLVKNLEEKLGVSAAAAAVAVPSGGASAEAAATEEQTEFSVVLTGVTGNKIAVIKAVREVTSLGLKEAKEFVDNAPNSVKEDISKDEAESLQAKLTEAGATIELK